VLIYSYRVKYNGLLASLFLSPCEILLNELTLEFAIACNLVALIKSDLDGSLLRVFSCLISNFYATSCDIDCQISGFRSHDHYFRIEFQIRKDYRARRSSHDLPPPKQPRLPVRQAQIEPKRQKKN